MSFKSGFIKVSTSFSTGLSQAAKQTVGDTMKLKGAREAISGIRKSYSGKYKDLFKTELGRGTLAEAAGKALPSAVVGSGYAVVGKKILDKIDQSKKDKQQMYYGQ